MVSIEALPQDLLIKVPCGVDYDDLKRLFIVSKTFREAAMIAKRMHLDYITPTKIPCQEFEAPNAPKKSRAARSRLNNNREDMKPNNLLIGPPGQLKLADFGMARIYAEFMEKELDGDHEVVVEISSPEQTSNTNDANGNGKVDAAAEGIEKQESGSYSFKKFLQIDPPPALPATMLQAAPVNIDPGLRSRKKVPSFTSSSTLEIPKADPVAALKVEDDTGKRSLASSPYPKPKSRLIEPAIPNNWKMENDKVKSGSPSQETKTPIVSTPITPTTTQTEEDDDDDVYYTKLLQAKQTVKKSKKKKVLFFIEFSIFVCVSVVLVLSLTVDKLVNSDIWSLKLWKWCVLVLAIFCGRLFSEWFTNAIVFLIEKEYMLKKKVLYFLYSLQKSVQVFIWLGLILLTWGLLINHGVRRSRNTSKVLNYITRGIASTLVGSGAWVIKTLLVKLLASSFHVKLFFDRIQENIFHQYVLQTLSGPPLMEDTESLPSRQLNFRSEAGTQKKEKVIDVKKLQKMKKGKVSAWTMKGLIKVVRKSGFSTLTKTLDETEDNSEQYEQKEGNITCEWEAQNAGRAIFLNVAKHKKYIEEDDLLRFMTIDDVKKVLPLFEGAVETGKIKKKSFNNWVVNVYKERKYLALSLNDTKTAIEELNKLVSGLTLLLGVFMFGTSAKTAFEAIIFVFIMHPFDVGDRCVVDGVQLVVEEVNILTTIFLRYDNEKIFYPNAILATKAISNFNRSPEMGDSIEFDLDVSTSIEKILALKDKIKAKQGMKVDVLGTDNEGRMSHLTYQPTSTCKCLPARDTLKDVPSKHKWYIESKPQLWRPNHSVRVREIENVNKMKMSLYVTHTINFQNHEEKSDRKSNLVLELKNIFEQLDIQYHLLPQEVLIRYVGSASPPATTATRLS
ncbi:mechanosensitive ion channel MscS, LSM domain protein [Artemisia annua]|uniref:Mechanosensitive ion channel MscS, LSM domain protein n=1 Tax=Artemisia annua TaxID=35608 RepID=A0A2U1N9L4_ARTAN|nr:mechanosensitive ion channel MscS, LSM domain protein [Artemisia annua]